MPRSMLARVVVALLTALMLAWLPGCGRHSATAPLGLQSVRGFGAVGDGVTDDTQAILRAIAAGPAFVPAGTYRVTNLTLPDGATLTGAGPSSYIRGDVRCASAVSLTNVKIGIAGTPFTFVTGRPVGGSVFDHVVFAGGGADDPDTSTVILFDTGMTVYDTQFKDCTIETNPFQGNGIKMVDNGVPESTLHDITFSRCHFMSQPRMQFECIGRDFLGPRTLDYFNIRLVDCVFDVNGSEAISFDCVQGGSIGRDIVVQGCEIKGCGTNPAFPWHQSLEFGGVKNVEVIGNVFDRGDGWWINISGSGLDDSVFADNVFDSTVDNIGTGTNKNAQAWGGNPRDCVFRNNTVKMDGTAGFFWFRGATGNLFRGNRFTASGTSSDGRSYFVGGSSNNTFDGNSFATNASPALNFLGHSTDNVFRSTTWNVPGRYFYVEPGSGVIVMTASPSPSPGPSSP
jgi:hypothetical protein